LRIGAAISRTSTVKDVTYKEGRSGPLVFVVVRHEIRDREGIALVEEQDIVYRGHSSATAASLAPATHAWERTIRPDDVLLFRYSALIFNAHRIHYDRRYTTEIEGYPGLVVHGPLIATLLLDLLRRNLPDQNVSRFKFRAVSPLFDTGFFSVCGQSQGNEVSLWAKNASGALAMEATAQIDV